MEMPQGNSLCSYLKQTKMTFFKNREQEGKTGPGWEMAQVGEGRYKERVRRVNMVNIMHSCMKMEK
jgi:hypothetical protein